MYMNSLLGVAVLVFDIIAIMQVFKSNRTMAAKVIWTLAILIFPFVGMLAYFLFGEKPKA